MNVFKKNIAILLLSIITIIATACSSGISNEEILNNFYKNASSVKSSDIDLDMKVEMKEGNDNFNMTMKGKSSVITEPLAMALDMNTEILGDKTSIKIYLKDDYLYMASSENKNSWLKTKDSNLVETIKTQQNNIASTKILEVFKKSSEKTKVEKKDDKYTITYSGDGSEYKDIFIEQLALSMGGSSLQQISENIKIKNAKIVYIVDAKTFNPIESNSEITMEITENGKTGSVNTTTNMKFSNINNVKEISLPEEAKNAISLEDNLAEE